MTEATLFILLSLAEESRHGYAIIQDVSELTEGRINFSTGTLYGALKRLLEKGWIERSIDPSPEHSDRERKFYVLTTKGKSILAAETARLRRLVQVANRRSVGEQM